MTDVRMPTPAGTHLVEAPLIAGGMAPPPNDRAARHAYLNLAAELGDDLDIARAHARPGNVPTTATAGDTTKPNKGDTR